MLRDEEMQDEETRQLTQNMTRNWDTNWLSFEQMKKEEMKMKLEEDEQRMNILNVPGEVKELRWARYTKHT